MAIKYKSNFASIEKSLGTAIKKANYIVARETINGAKRITRVDSGALRDSYFFNETSTTGKNRRIEFSNSQKYFAFQEAGTKHIKATDALYKTITSRKEVIKKKYANQIMIESNKVK